MTASFSAAKPSRAGRDLLLARDHGRSRAAATNAADLGVILDAAHRAVSPSCDSRIDLGTVIEQRARRLRCRCERQS
jgi:hypothetical protein